MGASLLALLTAVSIWLSLGTFVVSGGDTSRIAALPSIWILGVLAVAAIAVARLAKLRLDDAWPLAISLILWLPFLPFKTPVAFLLWEGPIEGIVWSCVIVGLIAARRPALPKVLSDPAIAPWIAAVVLIAGWGVVFSQIRGVIPGGDEPHYLAATQSLLHDGDLRVANNYAKGEYLAYFPGKLEPHFLKRAASGEIYSIHMPGVSAIVLPAFAIAGYVGAVITMLVVAALTAMLTWRLAFRVSGDAAGAWIGTAAVFASAPYFFHAFTIYPEVIGSLCVMCGVWLLIELADGRDIAARSLIAAGTALAILPWLHSRFAILAAVLGVLIVLRLAQRSDPIKSIATFLAVPAVAGIAWFAYFYAIWGSPSPAAPYGADTSTSASYVLRGLIGLLVDQQFGVLTTAPVYLVAIAGGIVMLMRRPRLTIELMLIVVPYAIAVASYAMWWAGVAAPARFVVSILPLAALPIAAIWSRWRAVAGVLLIVSVALIVPRGFVEGGRFIYNSRTGIDATLQWLTSSFDLPAAMPSVHRTGGTTAIRDAVTWIVALAAAGGIAIAVARRWTAGARFALTTLLLAIAATLTCALHAAVDADRSKLSASSRLREWQTTIVDLNAMHALSRPQMLTAMAIDVRAGQRLNRVGAGEYAVASDAPPTFSVGRNDPPLGSPAGGRIRIPVNLQTLNVSNAATITPVAILKAASTRNATHAARYGRTRAFFFDEWAYVEPDGFWTRAHGTAEVVIDSDDPAPASGLPISITAGAVPTTVTISMGTWKQTVSLAASQKHDLVLPPVSDGVWPLRIASGDGFRPSEREPGNNDVRSLAAWITLIPR